MPRKIIAQIDTKALINNFNVVKCHATPSKVIAMLKADAYGHGADKVAKVLSGKADSYGVASIIEAINLKDRGIKDNITIMQGVYSDEELKIIAANNFTLVLNDTFQLELIENNPKLNINAWLKVNTGMNRLGFDYNNFNHTLKKAQAISNLNIIGIMSHYSSADEPNNPKTKKQTEKFNQIALTIPQSFQKSLANSAAILQWPHHENYWVRPGLMLYGAVPMNNIQANQFSLQPVMTLKAHILAIYNLNTGDKIGYNSKYCCTNPTRVGVVSIGYADGYPQNAPNGTPVLVNEKLTKTIGKVSMDLITIDLTSISAEIGSEVTLWGQGLPIETVSSYVNRSPYELFTQLGSRIEFFYK